MSATHIPTISMSSELETRRKSFCNFGWSWNVHNDHHKISIPFSIKNLSVKDVFSPNLISRGKSNKNKKYSKKKLTNLQFDFFTVPQKSNAFLKGEIELFFFFIFHSTPKELYDFLYFIHFIYDIEYGIKHCHSKMYAEIK